MLHKEFNAVSVLNLFNALFWAIDVATGAVVRYSILGYHVDLEPVVSYTIEDLEMNESGFFVIPKTKGTIKIQDFEYEVTLIITK